MQRTFYYHCQLCYCQCRGCWRCHCDAGSWLPGNLIHRDFTINRHQLGESPFAVGTVLATTEAADTMALLSGWWREEKTCLVHLLGDALCSHVCCCLCDSAAAEPLGWMGWDGCWFCGCGSLCDCSLWLWSIERGGGEYKNVRFRADSLANIKLNIWCGSSLNSRPNGEGTRLRRWRKASPPQPSVNRTEQNKTLIDEG